MIVVDIEGTGTDPTKDSLISIGAVDFANPHSRFYGECQIWLECKLTYNPVKFIGMTIADLNDKNKPTPEELVKMFLIWAKETGHNMLAGHNTSFDSQYIENAARRGNSNWPFGYRTVDLHTLGYITLLKNNPQKFSNERSVTADVIFEYVGLSKRTGPHNALEDALLEAESFSRLIYGKNLISEYKKYKIPDYLIK